MTPNPEAVRALSIFNAAMKQTWQMVDPLAPPPAGTYARGNYQGICEALHTVRDNFQRELDRLALAASPPAASVEAHMRLVDEHARRYNIEFDYGAVEHLQQRTAESRAAVESSARSLASLAAATVQAPVAHAAFQIRVDPSIPPDEVRFVDSSGKTVGRIVNFSTGPDVHFAVATPPAHPVERPPESLGAPASPSGSTLQPSVSAAIPSAHPWDDAIHCRLIELGWAPPERLRARLIELGWVSEPHNETLLTADDVQRARALIHECTGTDFVSGKCKNRGDRAWVYRKLCQAANLLLGDLPSATAPLQSRVQPWMMACFGPAISADKQERNHRFLEEALELVQACGCTQSEAHQLVDYNYGRPAGEASQEVGGVMITLAALCLAQGLDMHAAGETELARIWTKVDAIRAKQAAKPRVHDAPVSQHFGDLREDALPK